MGDAWEPSTKQTSFGNRTGWDRKVFSLSLGVKEINHGSSIRVETRNIMVPAKALEHQVFLPEEMPKKFLLIGTFCFLLSLFNNAALI